MAFINAGTEHKGKKVTVQDRVEVAPTKEYFNIDKSRRKNTLATIENNQMDPGSVYQIDSMVADVQLVNRLDRASNIGRPTVYFVIDTYTRKIVSHYVSINEPNWIALKMVLVDAFSNVDQDSEGINPLKKQCFLPEMIACDRGKENLIFASDLLSDCLSIRLTKTPSYRPDRKGILERLFSDLRKKNKDLPDAFKKCYGERGEKDYQLETGLDIEEFTKIIKMTVDHHNNRLMKDFPMDKDMLKS
jgi:hypothetical protein